MLFRKLGRLQLVPGAQLVNGHFVSRDGRCALLVAETDIPLTDSARGRELVARFDQAAAALPAGITATLVAGHRYTVANAETIQRDLVIVFTASALAIGLVFVVFIRHWRALFVFLVPAWVVVVATVAVGAVYSEVSAITLGFGAVLLGIAGDFSIYVYFAMRATRGEGADTLAHLTAPLSRCVLVTGGAFAVLLLSGLPGQRQLGLFAIAGLVAAMLISLLVLPHLIPPATTALPLAFVPRWAPRRAAVVVVWLVVLGSCLWCLPRLRFSGELRDLGVNVAALRAAEQRLADVWGDVRGRAMIFVPGPDLDSALAASDRLFTALSERVPGAALVTLAPVLPARATQAANGERWQAYWAGGADAKVRELLAQEGARAGFAPGAFAAFADGLTRPPAPFGEAELRAAGLGEVVDALVSRDAEGVRVMTLAPDTPEVTAAVADLRSEIPGVRLVSQVSFGTAVAKAVQRDFLRFLLLAGLVVVVLLTVLFRGRLYRVLLALVPVATGIVFMLGVMAAMGWPLNLFNIIASIMVIGLGVDYGIFMLYRLTGEGDPSTERAVLVSALINVTSFGALGLARHPALSSIGLSVGLGILAAMVSALVVIPALVGRQGRHA